MIGTSAMIRMIGTTTGGTIVTMKTTTKTKTKTIGQTRIGIGTGTEKTGMTKNLGRPGCAG
jgi:hypothetical protein